MKEKNKDPFQFYNIAKLIFSANHMPSVSDKSYGFTRRLLIIPFMNIFTMASGKRDPNLLTKLTTPSAQMYLLDIAVNALNRLIKQGEFSKSDEVDKMIEMYTIENNNCIQFIEENEELYDIDIKILYKRYCLFCATNNSSPYKRSRFTNEIMTKLPGIKIKKYYKTWSICSSIYKIKESLITLFF